MTHRVTFFIVAAFACTLAAIAGCTDEKTVYVERVLFEDPPAGAGNFLGYDDASTKLTVCGNCHVGQQTRWEGTAHAHAWNTLAQSGHMQGACQQCHSVNELGNAITASSGYNSTHDSRYQDVQCESCHGPGLDHVNAPDNTQPIASIAISQNPPTGCAECHNGVHHPFVEEWAQSKHGQVEPHVLEGLEGATPANYQTCRSCHTGQGALEAWGVDTRYIEQNPATSGHLAIVCAVCHDPHSAENAGQLRFPIDSPSENEQLCMKCHHRRAVPEVSAQSIRGPHSPEGPLLLGDAGWIPPNTDITQIETSHGPAGNPRLCATCHVASFTVTDELTGQFSFQATGHLFQAVPCLDATGKPTVGDSCDVSQRSFLACASSGCHSTEDQARSLFTFAKNTVNDLVQQVDDLLAQVPPSEFNLSDGKFTVADGAWFNARLGELPGSIIHNPFLVEQLLDASIQALMDTYGLAAPAGYDPTLKFHSRSHS